MKRLPALMLSVFMLTLLCLPTSAANNSANMKVLGSEDIPVKLNINDNNMVDVTIGVGINGRKPESLCLQGFRALLMIAAMLL